MEMSRQGVIIASMVVVGLLTGALGHRYLQPYLPEKQQPTVAPQPELSTDAFSLRWFQHLLKERPTGNVLATPLCISDALFSLRSMAGGKTLDELNALGVFEGYLPAPPASKSVALVAFDFNLPRRSDRVPALALPFSEDVPLALSMFNGSMGAAVGEMDFQLADSTTVSERTKLLVGTCTRFCADWQIPFNSANSRTADFDSESGGMPHFHQMRNRGLYRCAKAADASWQAIAIPLKGESTAVYIGILPGASARDFAANLTPEQLTAIRKALAEASPQDTLIELPRLEFRIIPHDLRDSLRRLGLKALFDSETADFSQLTSAGIHLGAFIHSASISLAEAKDKPAADDTLDYAPARISFDKPFIWLIADLESNAPIEIIGLAEEM